MQFYCAKTPKHIQMKNNSIHFKSQNVSFHPQWL